VAFGKATASLRRDPIADAAQDHTPKEELCGGSVTARLRCGLRLAAIETGRDHPRSYWIIKWILRSIRPANPRWCARPSRRFGRGACVGSSAPRNRAPILSRHQRLHAELQSYSRHRRGRQRARHLHPTPGRPLHARALSLRQVEVPSLRPVNEAAQDSEKGDTMKPIIRIE
jgi:hypothetical protein